MTMPNDGLNVARDAIISEAEIIAVGTDGSETQLTDSALGNEVLAKNTTDNPDDVSFSASGDGVVKSDLHLSLSDAVGESLKEISAESSSKFLLRLTFSEIQKENDFELDFEIETRFVNDG